MAHFSMLRAVGVVRFTEVVVSEVRTLSEIVRVGLPASSQVVGAASKSAPTFGTKNVAVGFGTN